jgi:hypothetical protein
MPAPEVDGLQFCALAAYYRRATPERDALLLLDPELAPPLPTAWAKRLLGNEALHLAARYGHSRVLRWLRGAYGLSAADARFRVCVDLGRYQYGLLGPGALGPPAPVDLVELLQIFVDAVAEGAAGTGGAPLYLQGAIAAAVTEGRAVSAAAMSGAAAVVRALVGTYELGAGDALCSSACRPPEVLEGTPLGDCLCFALRDDAGLDAARALWASAGLTPAHVDLFDWEEFLYEGAKGGRLSVLKWVEGACLPPLRVCGHSTFMGAVVGDQLEVLQWVCGLAARCGARLPWAYVSGVSEKLGSRAEAAWLKAEKCRFLDPLPPGVRRW